METVETVSIVSTGFQSGFHWKVRIIKPVSIVSNIFWRKMGGMVMTCEHAKHFVKRNFLNLVHITDLGKLALTAYKGEAV